MPSDQPNDLLAVMIGRIAWVCLSAVSAALLLAAVTGGTSAELPKYNLMVQDAPVLALLAAYLFIARRWLTADRFPPAFLPLDRLAAWRNVWIVAAVTACMAYAGNYYITQRFALSFDEFLADFDTKIIASGRLLAPVAPEWRDYVQALQPMLMLQVPDGDYWVSRYLPVNAAIRALFSLLGDAALAGPVLAAVALLALYGVARRLWPARPDAAFVAVLLLACSSQFLITAMTPYAMTAHLALNLVWLWLFLRDTRTSHVLAVLVAFAACGLHQVVFHPLFAAPFLLTVLRERRWKLASFYAVSYAAICLFWILYWSMLLHGIGESGRQSVDPGITNFLQHVTDMVDHKILATIPHVAFLLFRFIAWQSPILIPLALVGFIAWRKQSTAIRDLALGIAFILIVLLLLVPFQGHGWGYRYVHGLLGSVALLAAQGWICVTARTEQIRRQTALLLTSLLISLLVALPWYGYHVHRFIAPYRTATEAIERSGAQIVLIDPVNVWYGSDLARNDPFLRTSPRVMVMGNLDRATLAALCSRYDVAVFDRRAADRYGLPSEPTELLSPQAFVDYRAARQTLASLNCGRPFAGD